MGARHVCEWCNGRTRGRLCLCNSHRLARIRRQTRPTPALPRETRFGLTAGAGGRRTRDHGGGHFPYWGIFNFGHQ